MADAEIKVRYLGESVNPFQPTDKLLVWETVFPTGNSQTAHVTDALGIGLTGTDNILVDFSTADENSAYEVNVYTVPLNYSPEFMPTKNGKTTYSWEMMTDVKRMESQSDLLDLVNVFLKIENLQVVQLNVTFEQEYNDEGGTFLSSSTYLSDEVLINPPEEDFDVNDDFHEFFEDLSFSYLDGESADLKLDREVLTKWQNDGENLSHLLDLIRIVK